MVSIRLGRTSRNFAIELTAAATSVAAAEQLGDAARRRYIGPEGQSIDHLGQGEQLTVICDLHGARPRRLASEAQKGGGCSRRGARSRGWHQRHRADPLE